MTEKPILSKRTIDSDLVAIHRCSQSTLKKECARFSNRDPTKEPLIAPNHLTGQNAVLCGIYTTGLCLVVIDFDPAIKGKDITLEVPDTFTVKTGSGGIHCYFWVSDKIAQHPYKNCKDPSLREIDIKSIGGFVYAPGCDFTKDPDAHHIHPYIIVNPKPITKISKTEFDQILQNYLLPEDLPYPPGMRRGFIDIWTGKFKIEHLSQSQTKVEEFHYWAAFWREFLGCNGKETEAYQQLSRTQPEFDQSTTEQQLKYLKVDKRPTREYYAKLFPDCIDEKYTLGNDTPKITPISIDINNIIEKIETQFENRIKWLEKCMISLQNNYKYLKRNRDNKEYAKKKHAVKENI